MSDILVHTEAGVMTLTFNRVQRKNSITSAMYAALADALTQAQDDAAVRCVLIQGDATIFSAGNDIGDFLNAPPAAGKDAPPSPEFRFLHGIAAFPKPIVAAVCGPAVGIGTTLLLHCDLVYAGDNSAFSVPFVNLGLVPEAASSLLMPRTIGHQRAFAMLVMGRTVDADHAREAGFVNEVVAPGQTEAEARKVVRDICALPTEAVAISRRLLKLPPEDMTRRIDQEAHLFAERLRSTEAVAAFKSFMARRKG